MKHKIFVPQNFLMCVFDAQYGQDLQLDGGTPTRLGDLEFKLNLV